MNYYQPARYSYSCYSMLSFTLSVPNTIYNYLYISKLYIICVIERTSEINCHNCNCHKLRPFYFFLFYLFTFPLSGHRVPDKVRYRLRAQIAPG